MGSSLSHAICFSHREFGNGMYKIRLNKKVSTYDIPEADQQEKSGFLMKFAEYRTMISIYDDFQ